MIRTLVQRLHAHLTGHIARDRDALAVVLRSLRDAEESGEAQVFCVDMPQLPPAIAGLVARHGADEERHVDLMERALAAIDAQAVGDGHTHVFAQVDAVAGAVFEQDLTDPVRFAEAYFLLYAMERRLSAFLHNLERHVRPVEPALADVLAEVRADEEKHIVWCQVVAWEALDGDRAAWEAARERMIAVEARSFARIQGANLAEIVTTTLSAMPTWQRGLWWGVAQVLQHGHISYPVPDPEGRLAAREWRPAGCRTDRDPAPYSVSRARMPAPPQPS